jgi:DNA polymerase-3 subunit delta'
LKTVEEPPPATVFVLLAEDIPNELVTVASRCVEVTFPPVPSVAVEEWLRANGIEAAQAAVVAAGAGGDLDRARLLAHDDGYAARLELWRSVPARLNGDGSVAGQLARSLLESIDGALDPLRAQHTAALEELSEQAESLGERAAPGRKDLVDRQHREERRWRTDELRAGLGILARAYRDRWGSGGSLDAPSLAECERAVSLITEATASLEHNPNETLLLESLLVRL